MVTEILVRLVVALVETDRRAFSIRKGGDFASVVDKRRVDKQRVGSRRQGMLAIHSGNGHRMLLQQQQQQQQRWWTCFLRADNKEDACPSDVNTKPRRRSRLTSRNER